MPTGHSGFCGAHWVVQMSPVPTDDDGLSFGIALATDPVARVRAMATKAEERRIL